MICRPSPVCIGLKSDTRTASRQATEPMTTIAGLAVKGDIASASVALAVSRIRQTANAFLTPRRTAAPLEADRRSHSTSGIESAR